MLTGPSTPRSTTNQPLVRGQVALGLTDLDGTAVDETVPESQRLATLPAAKNAFQRIQAEHGIQTGIVTGRSLGEAIFFHQKLEIAGPIICEDGAVLFLPKTKLDDVSASIQARYECSVTNGGVSLVLSETNAKTLQAFIGKHYPQAISSFSSFQEVQTVLNYPSEDAFNMAVLRRASAYLAAKPSKEEFARLHELASEEGLRAYSPNLPHLQGNDTDKGTALKLICSEPDIIKLINPEAVQTGFCPIVWGNNDNDIRLFAVAEALNGKGILIAHPNGGFFVPEALIPDTTIKTTRPFGEGILESLDAIRHWIKTP